MHGQTINIFRHIKAFILNTVKKQRNSKYFEFLMCSKLHKMNEPFMFENITEESLEILQAKFISFFFSLIINKNIGIRL
jgi:hypothetical protein